jgi:hypothetical protein
MYIYICVCVYAYYYVHMHLQVYIYIHIYICGTPPNVHRFCFTSGALALHGGAICNFLGAISPEKNQNSYRAQKEHSTRASNTRAFFWGSAEVHNSIQSPCFLAS